MSSFNDLFKNTFLYAIGKIGAKFLMFLLLPFFSFYLSREELGEYDLIMTFVALMVPIVSFEMSSAVLRWLLTSSKEDSIKSVSSSFAIFGFGIFFFVIFFNCLNFFFDFKYWIYLNIIIVLSTSLPYLQSLARGLKRIKLFAISGILNAFLLLTFNVIFFYFFKLNLIGVLVSFIASNLITSLYILLRLNLFLLLDFNCVSKIEIRSLLKYSLPLIPNKISWWMVNASDKFIILYFFSTEINGIYAISSRFPGLMILLNSVFILAWQDYAITSNNNDNFSQSKFSKYLRFEFGLVLVLISFSEFIVLNFIDYKFHESYKYMPLLYIGTAFSAFSGYFGAFFLKEKMTIDILKSSIMAGIVNVLISFIFMKKIGLFAPAFGTLVSFLIMFVMRAEKIKDVFKIKIDYTEVVCFTVLCLVFSYLVVVDNNILKLILMFTSLVLFVIINYPFLRNVFLLIKKRIAN